MWHCQKSSPTLSSNKTAIYLIKFNSEKQELPSSTRFFFFFQASVSLHSFYFKIKKNHLVTLENTSEVRK